MKSRWILFLVFFGISLMFSFGLGYRMGQDSMVRPSVQSPMVSLESSRDGSQTAVQSRAAEALPPRAISNQSGRQPVRASTDDSEEAYRLFFASFKKLADAEKEKSRLEARGLDGIEVIERPMPSESSVWYRLRYGRFQNRQAAVEAGRQLIARGVIRDFWPTPESSSPGSAERLIRSPENE